MSTVALSAPAAPAWPPWAVGRAVALLDVPPIYRDALRLIAWREGNEHDDELVVPEWAMRVCGLSRRGHSPLLGAWLEWCAAGGEEAAHRALLIQNLARLMPPEKALRAIHEMIQGGA